MPRLVPTAVILGLLCPLGACTLADPVADPEAGFRLSRDVVPSHYALTIALDLAAETFEGEAVIDVTLAVPTAEIVLHAAELTVHDATVEARGTSQPADVALDPDAERATLTVDQPMAAGPARIRLTYTGILNRQLRGLYLSEANGRRYAVTQLEATDARRMFPSFDEPSFKATFDLTVIVAEGDHAISNGTVLSDTPGPEPGRHTIRFSTTATMSTYLVALVAGDFECRAGAAGDIPIRVCATPDKLPLTGLALGMAEDALAYFGDYFDLPYPFGKLDIVAVPDFAAGAMENTAAIFYRETLLLADPDRAPLDLRKRMMAVLSHEIAHHWFGDLVTMAWWNDIWLNEGFASWMETKPMRAIHPEWRADLDEVNESLTAMATDRLASTRPVRNAADTTAEISAAFDAIAYSKGAAVLRMTEAFVGEDTFRRGINAYVSRFQYGNATSEDFWTTMAEATGTPIDRILSGFITQPGVPLVTAVASCAGDTTSIALSQTRYRLAGAADGTPDPLWTVPICLQGADGTERSADACHLLEAPTTTLTRPGCGSWTLVNADSTGYYRTSYDRDTLDRLREGVANLPATERLQLASDAWAAIEAGQGSLDTFLPLVEALAVDRTSSVLSALATPTGAIARNVTSPDNGDAYAAWVRRVFTPALADFGWTPVPGEPDDRREARAEVVSLLAGAGADSATIARARTLANRYLDDISVVDPSLVDPIVRIAAADGDEALYDRYLARYESTDNPQDRARFLRALARFEQPALVARTIELALSPRVRTQDAPFVFATALGGPLGRSEAWPLVRDRWDELMARVDGYFGIGNVVSALGSFCDPEAETELRAFFAGRDIGNADRQLRQALDRIASCVAVRDQQAPRLDAWLATQASR